MTKANPFETKVYNHVKDANPPLLQRVQTKISFDNSEQGGRDDSGENCISQKTSEQGSSDESGSAKHEQGCRADNDAIEPDLRRPRLQYKHLTCTTGNPRRKLRDELNDKVDAELKRKSRRTTTDSADTKLTPDEQVVTHPAKPMSKSLRNYFDKLRSGKA